MGADKANLLVGERPLVDHAVTTLECACDEVVLACGAEPRYEDRCLRLVLDSGDGRGPLEGIAASLEATGAEWAVVLACDLPRVLPEVPEALLKRAQQESLDACLFQSRRGREPLMAVYRRTCLDAMREALSLGLRRVDSFHELGEAAGAAFKIGSLEEGELSEQARSVDVAHNLNTPEELISERARHHEVLA
jgi:molybdopterin-guanine dinucleotide biosynthesis protein A